MDESNIVLKNAGKEMPLSTFLEIVAKFISTIYQENSYGVKLFGEPGKKYIRIVAREYNKETDNLIEHSGRAYCFLDYEGNIYKCASWKIPAKHIRGSVFDDNCSYGKALGPYGAASLR